MSFLTPRYIYDQLNREITEQFPADKHAEVYAMLEPFMEDNPGIAQRIMDRSRGSFNVMLQLLEIARIDQRDV